MKISTCFRMIDRRNCIRSMVLVTVVAFCLFESMLSRHSGIVREYEAALLSLQWMLVICLAGWCGMLFLLALDLKSILLVCVLAVALAKYSIAVRPVPDAVILLFGIIVGKGVWTAFNWDKRDVWNIIERVQHHRNGRMRHVTFLFHLICLLAFAAWWRVNVTSNAYHGPRWMGLWDNPNDYGLLMGAGVTLTIGLLIQILKSEKPKSPIKKEKSEVRSQESENGNNTKMRSSEFAVRSWPSYFTVLKSAIRNWHSAILLVAVIMMGVGLMMSCSRGAWVGTAIGLLYLAKHGTAESGKRKVKIFRYLLLIVLLVAVALVCWKTPESAPWYLKRLDLNRGSVQHRVAAWKAGFEMMRDHPFGIGWSKPVGIYQAYYSPPEDGAAAIKTNDYLMLGTQLGIPALLCFILYVALCLRNPRSEVHSSQPSVNGPQSTKCGTKELRIPNFEFRIKLACRSAAIAMLVAFWFDGGLFKLATASVFWILLELGAENRKAETGSTTREHRKHREGTTKDTNHMKTVSDALPKHAFAGLS